MSRALSSYPTDDVRYVPTIGETIARLEGLTLEQVVDVYNTQLSATTGELAIVGEFERQAAMAALSEILKDWNTEIKYRSIDREARSDMAGSKDNIVTPDKANAVFSAGLAFALDETDSAFPDAFQDEMVLPVKDPGEQEMPDPA